MENEVISEYKREVTIDGKEMIATIRAYEKPIRKSEIGNCYVRLEIEHGDTLWGEMNWSAEDITSSESDAVFNDIIKQPDVYKCK